MRYMLITGAASGLGLAFLLHYIQIPARIVVAVDRTWPESTSQIFSQLSEDQQKRIFRFNVDVSSESDVKSLINQIDAKFGKWAGRFGLVIHSAGVRGLVPHYPVKRSADVAKADSLDVMDSTTMMKTFEVNVAGTFLLLQTLIPYLRQNMSPLHFGFQDPCKVIIMGSRMGSIASNSAGGGYAYRASKAALNAVVKSLSLDVPDVCFINLHPGRVATNLCDGVREEGAMDVDDVLPGLVNMLEGLELRDSGRFVDGEGKDIPW